MNASSWRKTADLIAQETQANQQVQTVATADDSSPLQVNYGAEQPLAASTPRAYLTLTRETLVDAR